MLRHSFVRRSPASVTTARSARSIGAAALENELRFVPFELSYGLDLDPLAAAHLLAHGATESELAWFSEHGTRAGAICGNDYYATSEVEHGTDGPPRPSGVRLGYYHLARQYHEQAQTIQTVVSKAA